MFEAEKRQSQSEGKRMAVDLMWTALATIRVAPPFVLPKGNPPPDRPKKT